MGLIDDITAKIDANGDGRLNMEDLQGFKDRLPVEQYEQLKARADQNSDGKLSLEDITSVNMGSITDGLRDKLGGLFK